MKVFKLFQLIFAMDAFENLIGLFEVFELVVCFNPTLLVVASNGTTENFF
jgi:hypothetical protein